MKKYFYSASLFALILFFSVSSCSSSGGGNSSSKTEKSSQSHLKMKLSAIVDNQVLHGNAYVFLLPEGWTQNSSIDWDMSNSMFPANGQIEVKDPDGAASFHDYKTQFYMVASQTMYQTGFGPGRHYLGCLVTASMPNTTTDAALEALKVAGALPEGTEILETKVTAIPPQGEANIKAVRDNPQVQFISDNIVQKGVFTKAGQKYTVIISSAVNATINNSIGYRSWSVRPTVFIVRQDEKEKENTELLGTIYKSFRISPAFTEVYSQVSAKLSDKFYQGIRDAAALSAQISRNNDLMIQSIDQSYSQANKGYTPSKSDDGFDQYIRGTENYSDGSGSSYELPSTYNTAWKGSNGEIILTNENGYNPNSDKNVNNQNWEELKK